MRGICRYEKKFQAGSIAPGASFRGLQQIASL
jgi:hypothetical protein